MGLWAWLGPGLPTGYNLLRCFGVLLVPGEPDSTDSDNQVLNLAHFRDSGIATGYRLTHDIKMLSTVVHNWPRRKWWPTPIHV